MDTVGLPPREIEIKLEAEPREVDAVRAMLERWLGAPERVDHLVSRYFDTGGGDLRGHGLTLRVRNTGRGFVQTVKAAGSPAGGLLSRDEWERPLPSEAPDLDAVRSTPAGAVLAAAGMPLAPVFRSAVERRVWTVRRPAGTVEVAMDHGDVATADAVAPLLEVEIELKAGDTAAVLDLLAELPAEAGLTVGVTSKSERGFLLLDGAGEGPFKTEPVGLRPGMPAVDALRLILRSCLRQIRLNEPGALARRAPSLHQVRVGVRRLRSSLGLFADVLGDGRRASLQARLRALSQVLGEARNVDVLMDGLGDDGTPDGLRARLSSRRAEAYDRVEEALRAPSHAGLMLDLLRWIEGGAWISATRAEPIEPVAAAALRRSLRTIRQRGRRLARLSPAKRHRLRIAGKKLRYATEFMEGLARRPGRRRRHAAAVKALEHMQDALGTLNDRQNAGAIAGEIGGERFPGAALPEGDGERALLDKARKARRKLLDVEPFWHGWG